jgi:hypothetical protein
LPFGTPDRIVERATVDPRRRHLEILFAMAWKPCSFCRGIGIHFAVEFVFFLPWNSCLLWRGIFTLAEGLSESKRRNVWGPRRDRFGGLPGPFPK